nr:RNA-directed DNA polymerase, eukaryota, reverse transcriptase zinc-binding domain protein [Tanacetum cinerariifolium]
MNVMTFNSYGMGAGKCKAISKLCNKHNISFLGIQETHSLSIDPFKVKSLWGNFQFNSAICLSVGRSGGLLYVWDTSSFSKINVFAFDSFSKINVFAFDHFLIVEGNWLHSHLHCFMVNVYAPQDDRNKEILWNSILKFKEEHSGHYIIFGDFNVVRFASERIGTMFNSSSANAFNQFIINGSLWEFPHGGHLFTRINRCGNILSKLNRFLITEDSTSLMRNHSALLIDSNLCTIISDFWAHNETDYGSNSIVAFKNKIKALKNIIKEWSRNRKSSLFQKKEDLISKIKEFDDATIRRSGFIPSESDRPGWLESLHNIKREEQLDISKQAKVKWGIEADENTKFFHAVEFLNSSIMPKGCNTSFVAFIPKISNPVVVSDFRPISLIGAKYKIITKLLANRLAKVIDSVISREQTAFVKHRQILDGPLMVMHFMAFSDKWISWINGCLSHATALILVNGSPTREYHINRGLRQRDPLSPFLFIIAMEGLHVAVEDAISAGLYRGKWSLANIRNMTTILECFHRVSGLKINFHKSNLVGIGIPFEEVKILSQITGCHASHLSFTYLGLPVGYNMAVTKSWDPLIDKFSKRLSTWKASLLSIGGRTTLLTSVLGTIVTRLKDLKTGILWNSLEFQNTAGSKGKKVTKALSFYRMEMDKKVLNEIWKDKVELDGMIVKEDEEAIK